jgi:hypothetical protein
VANFGAALRDVDFLAAGRTAPPSARRLRLATGVSSSSGCQRTSEVAGSDGAQLARIGARPDARRYGVAARVTETPAWRTFIAAVWRHDLTMGTINLAIAGATGWAGSAIADGALAAPDITLKAAIARSSAGQDLGSALGRERLGVPVYANVGEALDGVDVLAEFTSHTHAKQIALAAIERGVAVVIGSSGLTADDFQEVDEAARAAGVGAVAAGRGSR